MADARRTVWILGAGFSRSLGGPLLPDLLSPPMNNFVGALYGGNQFIGDVGMHGPRVDDQRAERSAAELVRRLYEQCGGATAEPGRRFWEDAEAFLDQVDAAAHGGPGSPAASRISNALDLAFGDDYRPVDLSNVRDAARRLVAAACCAFLKDADTTEERWQPYMSWAKEMQPTDTVVTFNYDRVLEHLREPRAPAGACAFEIVVPETGFNDASYKAQVFKLHGSVDWHREEIEGGKVAYRSGNSPEYALECHGSHIGIATPGPTKRIAAEELGLLWTGARNRIQEAEVIVFVGFRFPPSDAEAREKLLGAVGTNSSRHVELHILLGPERSHRDVVRLDQLLRYAMIKTGRDEVTESRWGMTLFGQVKTFALTTHALFAEDFFTVWNRGLLWPPGLKVLNTGA